MDGWIRSSAAGSAYAIACVEGFRVDSISGAHPGSAVLLPLYLSKEKELGGDDKGAEE